MNTSRIVAVALMVVGLAGATRPAQAQAHAHHGGANTDSAAVAAVIAGFHAALQEGDSVQALALLSDDAVILESGETETKAQYRAGHLPGDIAFARAVRRERAPVRVVVSGDAAWASSSTVVRGTYRDREINSRSVELMVLRRTADGWRIAAIHWSSRSLGNR